MKAVIHTGFSNTMKHEAHAIHEGQATRSNRIYHDMVRGYADHMPSKKTIGHGGLHKFKKHALCGETIIHQPESSQ